MPRLRRAMDALYGLCIALSGSAMVLIAAVIPWSVYTRYVLNRAASWPEPLAVLLTIVLTFFGAAACYRAGLHVSVTVARQALPEPGRRAAELLAEAAVALVSLFMAVWGAKLAATTWHQSIADFPVLSAGATYLPIPIAGAVTLLFVLERIVLGPPATVTEPPPGAPTID
jgi:TRAP-type C4-dicarboxylate transport system permease small subunit